MPYSDSIPNPEFLRLKTARLRMRTYRPGDGALIFMAAQKNRAHLQRYEAENSLLGPRNTAEAELLVQEIFASAARGDYYLIGGFAADSDEFILQVYVGVVSRGLPEFEIGYFVDVDHEGQGYVSEAVRAVLKWLFNELKAHRVSLRCNDTNLRSTRVAERCGFTREGHLRETHRDPDGGFSGDFVFGLLRDEFR